MGKKKQRLKAELRKHNIGLAKAMDFIPIILNRKDLKQAQREYGWNNEMREFLKGYQNTLLSIPDISFEKSKPTIDLVSNEFEQKHPVVKLYPVSIVEKIHKIPSSLKNKDYHFIEHTATVDYDRMKKGQSEFRLMEQDYDPVSGQNIGIYCDHELNVVFNNFTQTIIKEKEIVKTKKTGVNKKQIEKKKKDFLHQKKKNMRIEDYNHLEKNLEEFTQQLLD